ncbi:hypothetical protein EXD82_04145 [Peptacetobacter hominis]|uniref:YitT family protein n=1 Tax=Peptacetobacter hominis TaxID=2743610 RepID=A0A544QVV4_9FIRM|nr:hypothetical protein [Peptacetobacter hominis]TQQ84823.1 hypothetical protein EXD82_04145 [Peptacetobacter hominis]
MFKNISERITKLVVGLFICSVGIIMTINSNLGMQPWDVLHRGISQKFGITIGTASIIVAALTMLAGLLLGNNIGWGTVCNIILVGFFMDFLLYTGWIPLGTGIVSGLILLIGGLIVMSFGMVVYMDSALGSGPRDGLMVCLQKKTGKTENVVKVTMDVAALAAGVLLGGQVGIGTVISAIGLGYAIKIVFKLCHFDGTRVENRYIVDDIKFIKGVASDKIR